MTTQVFIRMYLTVAFLTVLCPIVTQSSVLADMEVSVLEEHRITYSSAAIQTKFASAASFNARGMQHVYAITHTFLDLIQRRDVFPPSLNHSVLINTPKEKIPQILEQHWPEILLQYVGVATVAICGILMAIVVPVAGFCVCCCRCAGKCGASNIIYDKKGDACKRVFLGVVLSVFVVAAMFGVVSAFVTNQYAHDGLQQLPSRLTLATSDTSQYLDNTGREINSLLVTNYAELEEVLGEILDDSGPILKRTLAQVTQAVAIDNLASIVSGLGNVKRYLRDIQNKTLLLQDKVGQLKLGLNGSRVRLLQALKQCGEIPICTSFLTEFDFDKDLALAQHFESLPNQLPDVSLLMRDITDLINNDIEKKVRGGQKQLDKVKVDIENSMGDIRPQIKEEIRKMGKQLSDRAAEIQALLNEFDGNLVVVQRDVPKLNPFLAEYGDYLYYIGLGMSCLVLLILVCHVLGLFYGFCGKRPGNVYGDDCCNTGTGANWLIAGVYLTFMFSFVILILTTAQFLIGSSFDKVICEAFQNPNNSDVFELVDQNWIQPLLRKQYPDQPWSEEMSLKELIDRCHHNDTLYNITHLRHLYDVTELRQWRKEFGIGGFIQNLKNKIRLEDLQSIQILSPQAEKDLHELAESQISDLNFSNYTKLLEQQITNIDLASFTRKLRQVRERLGRSQGSSIVGPAIDNEALFLDQMEQVVVGMRVILRELHATVVALEKEAKFNKVPLREALRGLLKQASKASEFLRSEGPQLIDTLTEKYVNETVGLIDGYVERVINLTHNFVGRCEPLSRSYNATVIAVCNEIIDSFNGFWTSIGWCYLFFLPSVALAISLVSLYRKSEAYPGPLVEPQTEERTVAGGKKKKRGHRRNASEYLPDSAHYRAGYSYQDRENRFQDMAPRSYSSHSSSNNIPQRSSQVVEPPQTGGPPRYTSNPSLAEYERPPPYYFPSAPGASDMPPPLPAPNARP